MTQQRLHSDQLLGHGVLSETIIHFELEAVRKGTNEAWAEAYHRTSGLEYLWIVYTGRLRNNGKPGNTSTGLYESLALSNQLRRLMSGMDEHEHVPGAAAKHRAAAQDILRTVEQNQKAA